jgi:hypothetical protein
MAMMVFGKLLMDQRGKLDGITPSSKTFNKFTVQCELRTAISRSRRTKYPKREAAS